VDLDLSIAPIVTGLRRRISTGLRCVNKLTTPRGDPGAAGPSAALQSERQEQQKPRPVGTAGKRKRRAPKRLEPAGEEGAGLDDRGIALRTR
jgi:hypothetical protein